MEPVSKRLKEHYEKAFSEFGASSRGVDWGNDEDLLLRYDNMLSVARQEPSVSVSMLDVGCGYGGLLDHVMAQDIKIEYSGIDVAENMIAHAKTHHETGTFYLGDALHYPFDLPFDYVVCNGILTQKLDATIREMDQFANSLIGRMFELCNNGIAFNIMSDKVNFMAENLYYRSPVEMLSFCLDNLSSKVKVDHAYPLFEYTVYVFRD
ncbi:class I SAM-dependent methyltransferase [Luminiphilus sp.]|nr:class I SAM-dependent methyltransferase [Luminiphilus sp.]